MGVMEQANKLKGKEREQFLNEYHEAKKRLKDAQVYKPVKKQAKRKSKPRNGRVVVKTLEDLEGEKNANH